MRGLILGTDDADLHGYHPLPNEAFAHLDNREKGIRVIASAKGYENTRT